MTVAEMAERMSGLEYARWRSYFKAEHVRYERTMAKMKRPAKKRSR